MHWKPFTIPASPIAPEQIGEEAFGNGGHYTIVAMTRSNTPDSDEVDEADTDTDSETVLGYLVSRGLDAAPLLHVGAEGWVSRNEYRVPASELLATAKAFCEYWETEGEWPSEKSARFLGTAAVSGTEDPRSRAAMDNTPELPPSLLSAPAMFDVFSEDPLPDVEADIPTIPDSLRPARESDTGYFPAQPFTVVTTAPADPESGHEFVLHFEPSEERYYVYFFAEKRMAEALAAEYESVTGRSCEVVRFEARAIEERFGVRYFAADGREHRMSVQEYQNNREMKNEFRRDD